MKRSFNAMPPLYPNLALEAFESKVPAKIGFGMIRDWDPNDLVYSDRRPENDDLGFWDDINGDLQRSRTLDAACG